MADNKDEQCAFALTPPDADGVNNLFVGIPAACWEQIKDGRTVGFDLGKSSLQIPIRFIFFGAESHAAALKILQDSVSKQGHAYLDERNRDLTPDAFKKDDERG